MASQTYDCLTPAGRTDGIKAAVDAIRAGQCMVMPTDTVYGIGCDAFNNDAVAKLCLLYTSPSPRDRG